MRRTLALSFVTALGAPACTAPLAAQSIAEVQVTPETMTLGVGQQQQLFAAAFDRQGNVLSTARFTYVSLDPAVARVGTDGTVVGVKAGQTKVEARAGTRRASLAVVVSGPAGAPAAESGPAAAAPATRGTASVLALDPATARLLPGERVRLIPQALRDDGTPVGLGRVQWKAIRPDIATVDGEGYVTAVAPGRTVIQASSGALMAAAPVEVEQAEFVLEPARVVIGSGDSDSVVARVPSQGNRELRVGFAWHAVDSTVARVGPTGVVQGIAPGETELVANGYLQERRIPVRVYQLATTFVVSPRTSAGPVQVPLHGTRTVSARALAADSSPIPEARVVWEVGDTALASYEPATGALTGKALGTTKLTARLGGFAPAEWTVQVVPGNVVLDRSRAGLLVGERLKLTPQLADDAGQPIAAAPEVTWSSDRSEVASVAADGTIDAIAPGHATVTAATPWGKRATADIFVVGDLLISSNRRGALGIYQAMLAAPDNFLPLYADSGSSIQAVRSPDRSRIAFVSNRGGNFDVYVMDADGKNVRRLTADRAADTDPVWTPDGGRILFTSARGGPTQIYSANLDGGDVRPLTSGPGGNSGAAVSPDGKQVVFASARDGNYVLYATTLDGGTPRRLTITPQREGNPRFLADGTLFYTSDRPNGTGSRVMRLPPGAAAGTVVTETPQTITGLAVSRDGSRIAYTLARLTGQRTEFALFVQPVGGPPAAVKLAPGEQVVAPSF